MLYRHNLLSGAAIAAGMAILVASAPTRVDASSGAGSSRTLTFEDRAGCQAKIERVFYNHRIWPKENPEPKPPFEQLVPAAAIKAKVERTDKLAGLLAERWQRPLAAEDLQREMERMSADSKDPAILGELFAALDHDPQLIALCLARPFLAESLVRREFDRDERIHAAARAEFAALRDRVLDEPWEGLPGYAVMDIPEKESARFAGVPLAGPVERITAPGESAQARLIRSSRAFRIEEDGAGLRYVRRVRGSAGMRLESVSVRKPALDAWLESLPAEHPALVMAVNSPFQLPKSPAATCATAWSYVRGTVTIPATTNANLLWINNKLVVGGQAQYDPATDRWYSLGSGNWNCTECFYTGTEIINYNQRYNLATDTWQNVTWDSNTPFGDGHLSVWTGTELLVWQPTKRDGGRYNPGTDSWIYIPSTLPNTPTIGNYSASAVWTGSEMYFWYGSGGARYTPSSNSWQTMGLTGSPPLGLFNYSMVWGGSALLVWGGSTATNSYTNSGAIYVPFTNSWSAIPINANTPTARNDHLTSWTGTEMIIWGGNGGGSTGARYNPSSGIWTVMNTVNAPIGYSALWSGSEFFVKGLYNYEFARYSPSSNTWVALSLLPADYRPAAFGYTLMSWTGAEVVLLTGEDFDSSRYYPSLDSHLPLPASGSTVNHRGVAWTGTELFVWPGGRYRPGSNSWVPYSVTAATPDAANCGRPVWSGNLLLVWGGDSSYSPGLCFGSRYNPLADSWATIRQDSNSPAMRDYNSQLWTGNSLLIWGGQSGSNLFTDGGLYDPVANSWIHRWPQLNSAAISGSAYAWTGTEMLLTGGGYAGKYHPGFDTWALFPLHPTLSYTTYGYGVRYSPPAVWTGGEMLLWNSSRGGRYSPTLNRWMEMTHPPLQMVIPRDGTSTVWMGNSYMVWGGRSFSSSVSYSDGAIYFPASDTLAESIMNGGKASVDVRLAWLPVSGAASYSAYRKSAPGSTTSWTRVASGLSSAQWNDPGQLSSGQSQFYSITTVNACGAESTP